MRPIFFATILLFLNTCAEKPKHTTSAKSPTGKQNIVQPEFQSILDSTMLSGSILIYDLEKDQYLSNDFDWAKQGQLPASTYKIPNSIIALETGVVENDSTFYKWDGKKRLFKMWERDFIFKDAFKFSCVPCYQEIARDIGTSRMNTYLSKLDFGQMKVDTNTIDNFWLVGDSKISQFQQIDFLKRLYQSQLPISARTESIVKNIMIMKETDQYTLRGKTGWAMDDGSNNGWFVGYVVSNGNTYFFATNVEPKENFNMDYFPKVRKEITYQALKQLNIIM